MDDPATNEAHVWVAAATVGLNEQKARHAVLRHSVRIPKDFKVNVLEVYCSECRRPWDDVAGEPCIAASNNEHLRGGPIGERKKRKHDHRCDLLGCEGRTGGGGVSAAS